MGGGAKDEEHEEDGGDGVVEIFGGRASQARGGGWIGAVFGHGLRGDGI